MNETETHQSDKDKLSSLINNDSGARRRHAYGLVRLMKSLRVILPLLVIVLLGAIYNLADFRSTTPTQTATQNSKGEQSTNALINPRFESQDAEGRPFTITADKAFHPDDGGTGKPEKATQSMGLTNADEIHLQQPLGDIALANGSWLAAEADRGIYHREAKTLDLHENVRIFHDSGYELNTAELHIDIAAMTARNDVAVTVTGPKGKINAKGLRADKGAGTLIFHGPARLEMHSGVALP